MDDGTSYPIGDEIDPDQARFLYENHCAILIVEDLPVNSEFGIDLSAYRIGDKFRGVKLIPPGIHFIYASASEKNSQQLGPRNGFYYNFGRKEVLVKRWSCKDEDFDDSYEPTEDHKQRYTSNLRELDRYLGVYKFSTYSKFLSLTTKLAWSHVKDLMPKCNRIRSVPYLVRKDDDGSSSSSERPSFSRRGMNDPTDDGRNFLPDFKPSDDSVIRFTPIPEPNEVRQTLEAGDYLRIPIKRLECAFENSEGRTRLLAELQFAFVTLILGHVYDCFERWARLLELICLAASEAAEDYPAFYVQFVEVLRVQLDELPEELFEDMTSGSADNLVSKLLEKFFVGIEEISATDENLLLVSKVRWLREFVESKFNWRFELNQNEPVIV